MISLAFFQGFIVYKYTPSSYTRIITPLQYENHLGWSIVHSVIEYSDGRYSNRFGSSWNIESSSYIKASLLWILYFKVGQK
jgi:hypothetical protein